MNGAKQVPNAEGVEALCVSTEMINALMPCVVKAATIVSWGFNYHGKIKAGLWWKVSDVPAILLHLESEIALARSRL